MNEIERKIGLEHMMKFVETYYDEKTSLTLQKIMAEQIVRTLIEDLGLQMVLSAIKNVSMMHLDSAATARDEEYAYQSPSKESQKNDLEIQRRRYEIDAINMAIDCLKKTPAILADTYKLGTRRQSGK